MTTKLRLMHRQTRCIAGINIDEVRGLAAILVVAFHAVASEPALTNTVWGYIVASFVFVRMPLFIAISGYLYGAQRNDRPLSFAGWEKRTRRIVPPFLLGTIVCWVFSAPTDHSFNIWAGLVFGAWHLWYLQALALILFFVTILDTYVKPSNERLWLWAAAAFVIASATPLDGVTWFSLHRALYLLPHFLAGAAVGAMPEAINKKSTRSAIYLCGIVAFCTQQLALLNYIPTFSKTSIPASFIGFSAFIFIARHLGQGNALRRVGAYSFPIYLWHLPVSSVLTALCIRHIDIDAQLAVGIKFAIGISVPMLVSMGCARYAPYLLTFVGRRATSKILRSRHADASQDNVRLAPEAGQAQYDIAASRAEANLSVLARHESNISESAPNNKLAA